MPKGCTNFFIDLWQKKNITYIIWNALPTQLEEVATHLTKHANLQPPQVENLGFSIIL